MKTEKRVLAKEMVQAGNRLMPGDVVWLRPDQIERLEAEGYFESERNRKTPQKTVQEKTK